MICVAMTSPVSTDLLCNSKNNSFERCSADKPSQGCKVKMRLEQAMRVRRVLCGHPGRNESKAGGPPLTILGHSGDRRTFPNFNETEDE